MREYPGYTYDTILSEYAIRVYSLVNEATKAKAMAQLKMIEAAVMPNQDESVYDRTIRYYMNQAGIVEEDDEDGGMDRLRGILGG